MLNCFHDIVSAMLIVLLPRYYQKTIMPVE